MIIVSNASPIIALNELDKLQLLRDLFQEIIIPKEVDNELSPGKSSRFQIEDSSWIKVQSPKDQLAVGVLTYFLDSGEAEAIILAKELSADRLIIDEKAGRKTAKRLDLNIIGTLGFLLLAKEEGLISNITPCLDKLKQVGFWFSEELKELVLEKADELD